MRGNTLNSQNENRLVAENRIKIAASVLIWVAFRQTFAGGIVIDKKEDKQNDEEKRKTSWTGKIIHGQYARAIVEAGADVEETWSWLHQQDLKKETEGLIIAAQDQALRTNYIKFRIDKTATSPMC